MSTAQQTAGNIEQHQKIILFDGVCNLCEQSVQFVLRRDRKGIFKFASLQSTIGQQLLQHYGLNTTELSSFVLIDNGKAWTKSSGALRVAKYLSGGWKLLYVFNLLPRLLRDPVYNFIAANRYRWYGKKTSCWMPTPELRSRFLD